MTTTTLLSNSTRHQHRTYNVFASPAGRLFRVDKKTGEATRLPRGRCTECGKKKKAAEFGDDDRTLCKPCGKAQQPKTRSKNFFGQRRSLRSFELPPESAPTTRSEYLKARALAVAAIQKERARKARQYQRRKSRKALEAASDDQ